jgi:hypothetical protein
VNSPGDRRPAPDVVPAPSLAAVAVVAIVEGFGWLAAITGLTMLTELIV